MTTEEQLKIFREGYRSVNVMVYDEFLVYKVADFSLVEGAAKDANKLILKLGLDLRARPGNVVFSKCFIVERVKNTPVDA